MSQAIGRGEDYVENNQDKLVRVLKHSDDDFTRALVISVLMKYGDDPTIDQVKRELEAGEQVLRE